MIVNSYSGQDLGNYQNTLNYNEETEMPFSIIFSVLRCLSLQRVFFCCCHLCLSCTELLTKGDSRERESQNTRDRDGGGGGRLGFRLLFFGFGLLVRACDWIWVSISILDFDFDLGVLISISISIWESSIGGFRL